VLDRISGTEATVSRATVFNALADLTSNGLVMRADTGPGAARYEVATTGHHHFVCNRCGRVADVPMTLDAPESPEPTGIDGRVDDTHVLYRGVCSECLAAEH
jgi:Fur family transcriptional regulator, peroxide stress response regulator